MLQVNPPPIDVQRHDFRKTTINTLLSTCFRLISAFSHDSHLSVFLFTEQALHKRLMAFLALKSSRLDFLDTDLLSY